MDWKTILIVGLGIVSIVVLYYCYKKYYNEEGFQSSNKIVRSEIFENSSVTSRQYMFSGSIITLREIYTEIVKFLTDYRNYSGYANAVKSYYKNLTIVDFPYQVGSRYWFPYTGQYGNSRIWEDNFSEEISPIRGIINLNVYNNNLARYKNFINTYSGSNKQKFLFNRSLAKPFLLYRELDNLSQPPTSYNLINSSGAIIDTNITEVANFTQANQSWYSEFTSYAQVNKNLYPQSFVRSDTSYHILYSGNPNYDKPPNLTFAQVNNGKKAGEIVNKIPDKRYTLETAKLEQLELNVYGGELTLNQRSNFTDSMFLGSVFANFDDQYNLDTILRVPYNEPINGLNCYYSFNMFLPELTVSVTEVNGIRKFVYGADESANGSIAYNTKLLSLRNYTNNSIKLLSDNELNVSNETFINNVRGGFPSKPFTRITSSNEAYVGKITREMLAKIPNLARRYITSWTYNRSKKLLDVHLNDLTSADLNSNELKKARYIYVAMTNFSGEKLSDFLSIYAEYDSYTNNAGTFTTDATLSNVPNEEVAKRIVASSRIYNSYRYTNKILELSRGIVGNTFNAGDTNNYFRNADPIQSVSGNIISSLLSVLDRIGPAFITFPTNGITDAKGIIDALPSASTTGSFKTLLNTTKSSIDYVKSIMNDINTVSDIIHEHLNSSIIENDRSDVHINNAMIAVRELKSSINTTTILSELTISSISGNGTTNTITVNTVSTYSIGDYISISGTTSYNGEGYKIININSSTNTIIISSTRTGSSETPSSGRIKLYSLKRYIQEASTNIISLISNVTTTGLSDTETERINTAKKNIEFNKLFIDSFNNNIETIIDSITSIYEVIDTIQMMSKIIKNKNLITTWVASIRYEINDYVRVGRNVYKSKKVNTNVSVTDSTHWLPLTDSSVKSYIDTTITNITGTITKFTTFISNLDSIRTDALNGDTRYKILLAEVANSVRATATFRAAKQLEFDTYVAELYRTQPYSNVISILPHFTNSKTSIESLKTIIVNLKTSIGEGFIVGAIGAPNELELNTLISDFNQLMYNNKLLPDYGPLSNLNISDSSFLNSIAQLYYESSDGLYEMTTIYDIYMIGSNSIDIRFDKKQRLPQGRINNLNIQYLPQVQEYNRLLDIMDDGSWLNYYKDSNYTRNGQTLTSNAIDFYYEDLSAATSKLEPIFNPVYPIDQNINVKDLQIELSNLNTSNELITKILTGKLRRGERAYIPETQETVGYNYTDRLTIVQYSIQDRMYKIETQISGILQSCARVFITPERLEGGKWKFPIDGMAIGINAALTYNPAYNGNLEVDMANTQGNIGQYFPTIIYTKNATPPIVCGNIKFMNKAAALFNQTAFLNLSSFTTRITGDDITKRRETEEPDTFTANSNARSSNFYDSNDGPLYVDKILGFEQVNENTCRYKWQETQYDPLTNGPFITDRGVKQQRIRNVQYQFMYDNLEYQNPKLIPDNNPKGTRSNEGFRYLTDTNVLFGDLYLSLYSWYAAATRNLTTYLYELSNKYATLYTPQYDTLVTNYNSQTSNLSTLNHSTIALFSTNFLIAEDLNRMFSNVTVVDSFNDIIDKQRVGTCDSIITNPPIFTNNYNSITYNYRPGNDKGLTIVNNERAIQERILTLQTRAEETDDYIDDNNNFDQQRFDADLETIRRDRRSYGAYNKYRTVDIKDFFTDIFNKVYRHDISKCVNPTIDPENCFTIDNDGCKYQFNGDINSELYRRVTSNLNLRNDIRQQITVTDTILKTNKDTITSLLNERINILDDTIIQRRGRINEEIYDELSNINNELTGIINEISNTNASININRTRYDTLLATQTSDSNLPVYMANQVIPITKPLPEEAYSLDNQYGQCPSYLCTEPVVMNSLVEQYNLDNDYDDTITSILKGATPNPFQCDYLVEVRKKNAITTDNTTAFNMIRFTPFQPSYSDNKSAIYFSGSNYLFLTNSCINLNSNNFTIDWFQYAVFDSTNPNPVVFSYGQGGNRNLSVQFFTINSSTIRFSLYINNSEFLNVDLNYNQLNRWVYFAIVRYNNIITCYKDGFAFISKKMTLETLVVANSLNISIGNHGNETALLGTYFKGGIRNFSFNNYDALYMDNIFNKVPTGPIKNINTKFIIRENSATNSISNIILRVINARNILPNSVSFGQITSIYETFITNSAILTELAKGSYTRNGIAIDGTLVYITDREKHIIKKLDSNGVYTTVAGTGVTGRGKDILASQAALSYPSGVTYGNRLYIADTGNNRICHIVGNFLYELVTDIPNVTYIAYDNLYIYYINTSTKKIGRRQVDSPYNHQPQYISLPDTSNPCGISFDNNGNLYIVDSFNKAIYKVLNGTTTPLYTIVSSGLASPVSVTTDSYENIYIADKDNKCIYMSINNGSQSYNYPVQIAGNKSTYSVYNEGYARIISIVPEFILYNLYNNRLYIIDSRKFCYIEKADIPNAPTNSSYLFNNQSPTISSLKIGELGESVYKFDKNLFTIQWFMSMQGYGLQTIFTFEAGSRIQLGVIFDIGFSTTKMNLYINERIYPYNENNEPTPIEFSTPEITGLWVHMGIVNNGKTLSIYKNSILIFSLDSTSISFNNIVDSQLTIGNRLSSTVGTGFKGQIRSFLIYNKLAKNYNNTIEPYTNSSFSCISNLVLHFANGEVVDENDYNNVDLSITNTNISNRGSVKTIESYPFSASYNPFKIKLYYSEDSDKEPEDINFYVRQAYGVPFTTNLGELNNIVSFSIYTLSYEKSVQQWLLEGSPDSGRTWYKLHEQLTPYISRSSPIYPAFNTYSENFAIVAERNVGGDIVKMTKSFQVARLIEDCSFVITSNVIDDEYSKGVTSGNGFFIQDNTPYVKDTSGSDISGFQFVGDLLGDYESNIRSLYNPIISDSSGILIKMSDAYSQSRSDTYSAVGKLNTLNFYSNKFNKYDSLRSYMSSNVRFTNSIFDSYSDSNSYMSNIIRFSIVDSNKIDIVFNKVDLTGLSLAALPASYANRTTTAGARYTLSVTPGFLDLTATFLSNVTPFPNIFNDDFASLTNSRLITYKDRLNQREKLSPIRTVLTSVTTSPLPTDITVIENLTGLKDIIGTRTLPSPEINTVEYMLNNNGENLPISKTNYFVQYVSVSEVNSIIPATLDTTLFKENITVANINTLIEKFKLHFNGLYASENDYPYSSVMKKVYSYSIVNNILYVSCSVEYKKNSQIYYEKLPNISEFGTELYYKVIFKNGTAAEGILVRAFEPTTSGDGGELTSITDNTTLEVGETTVSGIKNKYKKNLLWKKIKFKPSASTSSRVTYSISQIQFFNSALRNNKPLYVDSISIDNGTNLNRFDLTRLIDGVNTQIRDSRYMTDRIFTYPYVGGELTATFREGTVVDGFSFMTGYSLTNPEKWTIEGTIDGIQWIELLRQEQTYTGINGTYNSFFKTPIFSFISEANISLPIVGLHNIPDQIETSTYRYLRIYAKSRSTNFQLINITLYNGNQKLTNITTTNSSTNFLFNENNLTQDNVTTVSIYEAPANNNVYKTFNNVSLSIEFNSSISFNGISFITGIDVNKCMMQWLIEASPNGTDWNQIHKQDYTYINLSINYPHFFCRTPIFYKNNKIIDTSQPSYYDTKTWPITRVRFRPLSIPEIDSGEVFEISEFYFFNDQNDITSTITSTTNNNLLTYKDVFTANISDFQIYRGEYGRDSIDFNFVSPISFNGFSFMSGSQKNTCVQLWDLEVSIDGNFWVIFHSTNDNIYKNNLYPSPYYRIPVIYFQNETFIDNNNNNINKYYIVSGNENSPYNNGTLFEINIILTTVEIGGEGQIIRRVRFSTTDYNDAYNGTVSKSDTIFDDEYYSYSWTEFMRNHKINSSKSVYYKNEYPNTYGGSTVKSKNLYEVGVKAGINYSLTLLLDNTPVPNLIPPIYGPFNDDFLPPTPFKLYTDQKRYGTSFLFDTNTNYHLKQYSFWIKPSSYQGFTNYKSIDYISSFLLHTNKSFNSDLFRLIGSNSRIIPKKYYRVEFDSRNIVVYLNVHVEIIGYTITTGLYSHLSDANSWKVFGLKKNEWILLDKQDEYDIPVERSYTLPPFYFNSKKIVKNDSMPHMKIIEDYYKKKINPFGKAVFKKYMFDNNKTYYMVFDEYDNNRNLIDTDLIIGFVIVKGVVKKPVMYENPDGSFDAFDLKKKEMMAFWKKKIGLKLETKYLSDY